MTPVQTLRTAARDCYYAALRLLPLTTRRRLLFRRWHRAPLELSPPRTFSHKLNWRILHDRRPDLAWTCDKLGMKEHAERAGTGVRVPRTLWSGTDVRDLAAVDLPERWVLKPNNRSGIVHLGRGRPDVEALRRSTARWLRDRQSTSLGEWAYGLARPVLVAEEWVGDDDQPPEDYKFFVFDGQVRLVDKHLDRFGAHTARYYLPDWTPLETGSGVGLAPVEEPPPALADMVAAASAIGAGFDFMRVDLYWASGEIWFGEVTPYPAGGLDRFDPVSLDEQLGSWWTLPGTAAR